MGKTLVRMKALLMTEQAVASPGRTVFTEDLGTQGGKTSVTDKEATCLVTGNVAE